MPNNKMTTETGQTVTREEYRLICNGRQINKLQCINKEDMRIVEPLDRLGITEEGRIVIKDEEGDIDVRLYNFDRVTMNVQSRKLLDMLLMKISERVHLEKSPKWADYCRIRGVEVSLDEFMSLCGLSDRKNARDQFRKAGQCLFSIAMSFEYSEWRETGKRRKEHKHTFGANLFEATLRTDIFENDIIVDSKIEFRFGPSLLEYLGYRHIMPINIKIFSIDTRKNPHAYNLARHFLDVYCVKKDKRQTPRISVKSLLDVCPELPTVDEVREKGNREYWQKIQEPVQRDLDALSDIYGIVHWEYCHKKGIPLTDEELGLTASGKKAYKFEDWLDLMIDFSLPGYPERE